MALTFILLALYIYYLTIPNGIPKMRNPPKPPKKKLEANRQYQVYIMGQQVYLSGKTIVRLKPHLFTLA